MPSVWKFSCHIFPINLNSTVPYLSKVTSSASFLGLYSSQLIRTPKTLSHLGKWNFLHSSLADLFETSYIFTCTTVTPPIVDFRKVFGLVNYTIIISKPWKRNFIANSLRGPHRQLEGSPLSRLFLFPASAYVWCHNEFRLPLCLLMFDAFTTTPHRRK